MTSSKNITISDNGIYSFFQSSSFSDTITLPGVSAQRIRGSLWKIEAKTPKRLQKVITSLIGGKDFPLEIWTRSRNFRGWRIKIIPLNFVRNRWVGIAHPRHGDYLAPVTATGATWRQAAMGIEAEVRKRTRHWEVAA